MQVVLDDYGWAAGVATELVNTSAGTGSAVEQLAGAEDVVAFLVAQRVAAPGGRAPACTRADVDDVHRLRDRVRLLIDHPERDALVRGATELTSAVAALTLVTRDDGPSRWAATAPSDATPAELLSLVCGVGVPGVVHTLGPERFRPCSSPTCSGVYIDTSRPGRRRYCAPGLCGNRVNVANHRARRRDDEPS